MSKFKTIFYAMRVRTLPLSLSGAISGSAIAYYLGVFDWLIFLLTIIVSSSLQILSNFSNDLGDTEKGTDNELRIGPARSVQTGLISMESMKKYIKIMIGVSLLSGVLLLLISPLMLFERILVFLLGLASIGAAIAYTQGRFSFGYRGLGDFFVFVFFGLVSVLGSLFLYIHHPNSAAVLPAIGVGFLSVAVLHLNNMRDRVNDKLNNKLTIAVRIGKENSKVYFLVLILLGCILWSSFVFTQNKVNLISYLYWVGFLPLFWVLARFFKVKEDKDYDRFLKPVALSTFFTSVLFFISQIF